MSKLKERKNFVLIAVVAFLLLLIGVGIILSRSDSEPFAEEISGEVPLSLPFSELEIKPGDGEAIFFSAEMQAEKLLEFAKQNGVNLPSFLTSFSETVSLSFMCKIRVNYREKYAKLKLLECEINGFAIPQKLLSDMGTINFDLEHSLVYRGEI